MFTPEESQLIKQSKVCYLVPCYGGAVFEMFFVSFVQSVIKLRQDNIAFSLETVSNESLVTRARNTLIAKGMANPSNTHFMFIDADVSFTTNDIYKLVAADKEVIGGLYPKKSYPINYVYNPLAVTDVPDEKGLQQIRHIGTGFMLIKRHAIERMFSHYVDLKYKNDLNLDKIYEQFMYALFDTSIDENQSYLSEDWTFCNRWRSIGGQVWMNKDVKLGHSGYHTFN